MQYIPDGHELLKWLLAAVLAAGILGSVSAAAAALVMRIPLIGPILAALIPPIMAQYERWLAKQLQQAADQAVKEVEAQDDIYPTLQPMKSEQKRNDALGMIKAKLPEAKTLSREALLRQIEAAVRRMKGN